MAKRANAIVISCRILIIVLCCIRIITAFTMMFLVNIPDFTYSKTVISDKMPSPYKNGFQHLMTALTIAFFCVIVANTISIFGAARLNRLTLVFHCCTLMLIITLVLFLSSEILGEQNKSPMHLSFKYYYYNNYSRNAVDWYQKNNTCCGLKGVKTFLKKKPMPRSCCAGMPLKCTKADRYEDFCKVKGELYLPISDNVVILFLIVIVFIAITVMELAATIYLLCHIRNEELKREVDEHIEQQLYAERYPNQPQYLDGSQNS